MCIRDRPDPVYNSKMVTRLINNIMYDGKKGVAQKIVYDAFEIVKEKTGNEDVYKRQASLWMSKCSPLKTATNCSPACARWSAATSVSYTHLDVYKRQVGRCAEKPDAP